MLRNGEEVHGYIERHDKHCIKLNRSGAPNLMIYKAVCRFFTGAHIDERASRG